MLASAVEGRGRVGEGGRTSGHRGPPGRGGRHPDAPISTLPLERLSDKGPGKLVLDERSRIRPPGYEISPAPIDRKGLASEWLPSYLRTASRGLPSHPMPTRLASSNRCAAKGAFAFPSGVRVVFTSSRRTPLGRRIRGGAVGDDSGPSRRPTPPLTVFACCRGSRSGRPLVGGMPYLARKARPPQWTHLLTFGPRSRPGEKRPHRRALSTTRPGPWFTPTHRPSLYTNERPRMHGASRWFAAKPGEAGYVAHPVLSRESCQTVTQDQTA